MTVLSYHLTSGILTEFYKVKQRQWENRWIPNKRIVLHTVRCVKAFFTYFISSSTLRYDSNLLLVLDRRPTGTCGAGVHGEDTAVALGMTRLLSKLWLDCRRPRGTVGAGMPWASFVDALWTSRRPTGRLRLIKSETSSLSLSCTLHRLCRVCLSSLSAVDKSDVHFASSHFLRATV